jgi:hypothetical protein
MLPDHLGELEPVQIRHADVHQNNGNLVLEELFERLLAGRGLDQVFPQVLKDHLVGHELGRVIIDQQDADFLVWVARHLRHSTLSGAATCAAPKAIVRC